MGYVWCDGYVWDMCGVRYVWDMCGVRYANNLLKNPATKRLSGKICPDLSKVVIGCCLFGVGNLEVLYSKPVWLEFSSGFVAPAPRPHRSPGLVWIYKNENVRFEKNQRKE